MQAQNLFRQPFGLPPSPEGKAQTETSSDLAIARPPSPEGKAKALPFGEGGPRQRWER